MHDEPFGPVDTIVVVDTEAELLAANERLQRRAGRQHGLRRRGARRQSWPSTSRPSKSGINKPRSRGDRAEPFGGRGASWKGAFVGGASLVQAVTLGPTRGAAVRQLPRLQPA